jgi:two-component system phosphate regulon sensor histidine kinase PhoR
MDPWLAGILLLGAAALAGGALAAFRRERRRREAADDELWRLHRALEDERRARRMQEAWIGGLSGASPEPLIIVDSDLRLVQTNAAARERFGDWGPGTSLMAFGRSRVLEEIAAEAAAQAGEIERLAEIEDQPYRVRALATGELVALALENLSEVRRLSRARQDMVANLSHELRTPLASLQLLAESLTSPLAEDPAVARQLAGRVLDEVQSLNQMSQEMLDLAAIESGRQVIRLVPTPLAEVVAIPLARLREQAGRQDVELRDETPSSWSILADRDQAARAMLNVLHNAVKFSPRGGVVTLLATEGGNGEAGTVDVQITDGGPGIPPAELGRIFERFYRGDQARDTPGTGLGLAITRHILRAHGGEAWAENRNPPENGAVFHLRFLKS